MYHTALEYGGYWVVDAPDGVRAFESAAEIQPDLIVTDLGLPGTRDGVGLARGLRQNPKTAGIPMLAVTGRDPGTLGDDAGLFAAVLLKPVAPDVLISRIRQTLRFSRELHKRSAQVRERVSQLLAASERMLERSHRSFSMRAVTAFAQPCPRCGETLAWAERRKMYGVTFDYFRRCANGCGLFCYNHSDKTMVTLTD